jgi:HEAT repeat protein
MSSLDGLFVLWSAAGAFSTVAMATGGRAVFVQWRTTSTTTRRARAWSAVSDAVTRFASGDQAAADEVLVAIQKPSLSRIAVEGLANAARIDPRVPEQLRGQTELVAHIHEWVVRELGQDDAGRRAGAVETVGALRLRQCRGSVALACTDPDPTVRVSACRALSTIDPDQAIGVLLGLVEKDGPWAADLLADLISRSDGTLSASSAVIARANEWAATPALLRLLANGKISGAERVMVGALDADDVKVRSNAAEALRESATPEAARALLGSLTDANEDIRLNVVRALGAVKGKKYALELAAMLGDPSRLVRFAAGEALSRIPGGRDLLRRAAESGDERAAEAAHVCLWQAEQTEQVAQQRAGKRREKTEHPVEDTIVEFRVTEDQAPINEYLIDT